MPKYIEREALLNAIETSRRNNPHSHSLVAKAHNNEHAHFISMTLAQPVADVVEVKHGYWKQNPYCKRIYYCSLCGRGIEDCTGNQNEHFPYCHCGAKMDGVENNQNHG